MKKILEQKDIDRILLKSRYWDEVVLRREGNEKEILLKELQKEISELRLKILWILKEYASEQYLETTIWHYNN